jgi:hypothetical protein
VATVEVLQEPGVQLERGLHRTKETTDLGTDDTSTRKQNFHTLHVGPGPVGNW